MPKTNSPSRRPERRSNRQRGNRQRHLSVRSELLREPDVNKIARAVVALAIAQAEKEAAELVDKDDAND